MDKNKIVVIITARGGSKRVPKKNLRKFMGLPLFVWSINAAKKSKIVNNIIVSSDDGEIIKISQQNNVKIHQRPKSLSSDHASTESLLNHIYFKTDLLKKTKYLILLQPTSPLRLKNFIEDAIKKLEKYKYLDGLIEVTQKTISSGNILNKIWKPDYSEDTRSQDIPPTYFPTGALYIYRCPNWFKNKTKKKIFAKIIHVSRVVNIDNEEDFDWAKFVYKKYKSDYEYLTNKNYTKT